MSCEDFLHNNLLKGEYQWQFYAILVLITQTIRQMIEYFRLNLLLQTIQFYRLKKVNFRSFAMT